MIGVIPGMQHTFLHKIGYRWLSEGAIAGLMVAAIAFWEFE